MRKNIVVFAILLFQLATFAAGDQAAALTQAAQGQNTAATEHEKTAAGLRKKAEEEKDPKKKEELEKKAKLAELEAAQQRTAAASNMRQAVELKKGNELEAKAIELDRKGDTQAAKGLRQAEETAQRLEQQAQDLRGTEGEGRMGDYLDEAQRIREQALSRPEALSSYEGAKIEPTGLKNSVGENLYKWESKAGTTNVSTEQYLRDIYRDVNTGTSTANSGSLAQIADQAGTANNAAAAGTDSVYNAQRFDQSFSVQNDSYSVNSLSSGSATSGARPPSSGFESPNPVGSGISTGGTSASSGVGPSTGTLASPGTLQMNQSAINQILYPTPTQAAPGHIFLPPYPTPAQNSYSINNAIPWPSNFPILIQ